MTITKLTMLMLGERIATLRRKKGFSQEALAGLIKISRPSLVQMEAGRRKMDALELKKLAQVLEFSLDDFLSADFETGPQAFKKKFAEEKKPVERPGKPVFSFTKFKNVFLYLLEQCSGKPNLDEAALNKLLYFADFNYFELYEEHLTGSVYRKLPFGPVPDKLSAVTEQLSVKKQIMKVKTSYGKELQTKYLALVKTDLRILKASEKEVIDRVISQMSDWTSSAITDYAQHDMPWLTTANGGVIDYELVFYREPPYSVRSYFEK